jgi:Heterokaryon incompatibility protein (HET)
MSWTPSFLKGSNVAKAENQPPVLPSPMVHEPLEKQVNATAEWANSEISDDAFLIEIHEKGHQPPPDRHERRGDDLGLNPSQARFCSTCRRLDFDAIFSAKPERSLTVEWETFRVLAHPSCPFCQFLVRTLNLSRDPLGAIPLAKDLEASLPRTILGRSDVFASYSVGKDSFRFGNRLSIQVADFDCPNHEGFSQVYILPYASANPGTTWADPHEHRDLFHGRRINPDFISLDMVSKWLRRCDEKHPSNVCRPGVHSKSHHAHHTGFRLLDVKSVCIVDPAPNERYVALSYVWGAGQLVLTKTNRASLVNPLALMAEISQLSRTVLDAIYLCRLIGERYLWVDALCIIQDENSDRNHQILHMDSIYRHAYFTIVAAAGDDCNSGLPGVPQMHERYLTQSMTTIKGAELITVQGSIVGDLSSSTWNSRGWTFQEGSLSGRCLIFLKDQVIFSCGVSVWLEDTHLEPCEDQSLSVLGYLHPRLDVEKLAHQSSEDIFMQQYEPLLGSYLRRHLSKDDDILNAFAGIATALQPYLGDSIAGLPEKYFTAAMTWRDLRSALSRREGFPSWSWSGWLHTEDSTVAFCSRETLSGIVPILFIWTRDPTGKVKMIQRRKLWGRLHASLRPHFALLDTNFVSAFFAALDRVDSPLYQSLNIIAFNTSSAHLFIVPRLEQAHESKESLTFNIINPNNQTILGAIMLRKEWARDQPALQQFIVIAQAMNRGQGPSLFIMLIEWVDDIAYRVNIATEAVAGRDWREASPQRIAIVLG